MRVTSSYLGDSSLVNMPLLASMGPLSHRMKTWFKWTEETFKQVRKSNHYEAVTFRFERVRNWVKAVRKDSNAQYFSDMTNIMFLDADRDQQKETKKAEEAESGMLGKFHKPKLPDLAMSQKQMNEFLENSELFTGKS